MKTNGSINFRVRALALFAILLIALPGVLDASRPTRVQQRQPEGLLQRFNTTRSFHSKYISRKLAGLPCSTCHTGIRSRGADIRICAGDRQPDSQGFTLTVHGANFAPSAVLEWNGSQRVTVVVSSNVLQAPINTSDLTTANFALVTVVNLGNNPQTSNTVLFTIRPLAPAVSLTQDPYFLDSGSNIATVGDFNGDGKPDVVTCRFNGYEKSIVSAYLGQDRYKFGPPIKTIIDGNCVSLFTGDFNGDHLLDLVVVSEIRRNATVVVCFGTVRENLPRAPLPG